ncbi:branched-chain amino acid ABC transporter permease [Corticibacter populi]|uniref:Branched-chain amino acid ABC transporter permease n=1 Tax=Corticibacter populi TaxID=1550736 RepID=A0A3M6QP38_9BURK|nr:branched-chain amino acid ABC transporter permease [Corticibacter populi]RMX04824.1 branched-chain amino acid ABC transporter permease [Corticibacter populi]RZS33757.1 amino acid/amide ABC transporter membrane protein 1 (HAAT family) [Corticibacter populi]
MEQFLQHTANGLVLGSTYALLGIGLTLIFGIMKVVNFAHGEFYALGAYVTYALVSLMGLNFFGSLVLAAIFGFVVGAAVEFVLLRKRKLESMDEVMLIMIALMLIMQNTELLLWGGIAKAVESPFGPESLHWAGVSISPIRLFVLCTAVLLLVVFYFMIEKSRIGLAMRSTFQDKDAAKIVGVNVSRIYMFTFALGSCMAAVAGALLAPVFVVSPTMGDLVNLKAFAIVILGGLGSISGAAIGGFVLAFVEEFGAGYVSTAYRDAFGFLIILAILAFRPQGIFSTKQRVG